MKKKLALLGAFLILCFAAGCGGASVEELRDWAAGLGVTLEG